MSIPNDLKDFATYSGARFIGEATMNRAPKLTRKVEEWIGGGMAGPIEIAQHLEKMDCEWEARGFSIDAFEQFGTDELGGVGLRFVGAYQHGDSGQVTKVEHVIRGNHKEIDAGEQKRSDNGTTKVASSVTVYTLFVDDREIVHVDMLNGIERYQGKDRREGIRAALGI